MKVLVKSAWGSADPTQAAFPFHHANAFAEAGKGLGSEKQLQSLGFNVEMRDPDALAKLIKVETARWKKLIEFNNMPLEN